MESIFCKDAAGNLDVLKNVFNDLMINYLFLRYSSCCFVS